MPVSSAISSYTAFMPAQGFPSRLYMRPSASWRRKSTASQSVSLMIQDNNHPISLGTLPAMLRNTHRCDEGVLNQVINSACDRFQSVRARTCFDEQVKAGAWVDATMILIAVEMPAWRLRRIVLDDGLWVCSLSRHPDLPLELDDTAEAFHRDLPLAVLSAFVEARLTTTRHPVPITAPKLHPQAHYAVCCENFA